MWVESKLLSIVVCIRKLSFYKKKTCLKVGYREKFLRIFVFNMLSIVHIKIKI